MAVRPATLIGPRQLEVIEGVEYVTQTYSVTPGGPGRALEWFVTGYSSIVTVVGHAAQGTTVDRFNFIKNARGTGVAEGTNPGDLGVEGFVGSIPVEVTVFAQI